MQPTLRGTQRTADSQATEGDDVFVNRFIYRFSAPRRGDIVVFRTTGISDPRVPPGQYYVKRVVGLPGERVRLAPPFVVINGQRLTAPPIFGKISQGLDGNGGYVAQGRFAKETDEIKLGADEYLVLGDNSQNSFDSRHFGPIRGQAIIGKVCYRYAPAGRKGWVE
jgi:signal peptidase I